MSEWEKMVLGVIAGATYDAIYVRKRGQSLLQMHLDTLPDDHPAVTGDDSRDQPFTPIEEL
ncbi:MAG: hypothetical protein R8J41_11105 [Alphaproteobacteria bacterium]|nr:hypothetical protein [Alphaproteobacteria bacterium]